MKKIILPLWILSAIGLFLYSFTQVDLSLTLSRASIFQTVEKMFQYVGYFNRPLSTVLYLVIIGVMFFLYGRTMKLVSQKKITRSMLMKIIIVVSLILFLSYNAFSYDLFNYIFDAKIITHYHANPYLHKALDYPGDPMLSFMHWTQRTYPYGPIWLFLTVPLSYIGFGYFFLTFYFFKLLMLASFIWSCLLIEKISKKLGLDPLFGVAAFALNPLVLIESLVSAHNDIVMMAFALFALFMFFEKKYFPSLIGLVISIGLKFATALMVPAFVAKGLFKLKIDMFFYILVVSMLLGVEFATARTNFQPWYLLFVLPFAAFIQNKYFVMIPVFILSICGLLQYAPFLYLGNWNPPVPFILTTSLEASIVVSAFVIVIYPFLRPKKVE